MNAVMRDKLRAVDPCFGVMGLAKKGSAFATTEAIF
jgi:hypothetical protein